MMLLLAVFLLLLNAFFVAAEFALVKVRSTQLAAKVKEGNSNAKVASHILKNIDPYLSATQLGITLASLGLGWVGEPAMERMLSPVFEYFGVHDPEILHSSSVIVGFIFISFFHIVIGEIAPKSLALARPVGTTLSVSIPMRICYFLFYPFLLVLNGASNALLRAMGVNNVGGGHTLTIGAEELEEITAESTRQGVLSESQGEMLSNVFIFPELTVRELMVPHNKVFFIDQHKEHTLEEVFHRFMEEGRSRAPLVNESLDQVIGILHVKDVAAALMNKQEVTLESLTRKPLFVPENMLAQRVLFQLKAKRNHMAIVVDEYGGTSGIATLEDILEELVGEIQDEFDREQLPIQKTSYGYLMDGLLSLVDLERTLSLEITESHADTINGYALEQLKDIPNPGDSFVLDGWEFKVQSMDGLRIGKLEARQIRK